MTDEQNTDQASSGLYAAYDKTYLRYVGGTHPTKAAAAKAAKAAGVSDFEIKAV